MRSLWRLTLLLTMVGAFGYLWAQEAAPAAAPATPAAAPAAPAAAPAAPAAAPAAPAAAPAAPAAAPAAPVAFAEKHPSPDYAKGLADRAAVIAAAKEITPERFPNADDVMVEDYIRTRYWADGAAITWDDTWCKVMTEKGRKDWETLQFGFYLGVDTMRVVIAEVIHPDGQATPIDVAASSKVMSSPDQMSANIYDPRSKTLTVGIAGVQIGDVVHYLSCHQLENPRVPNTWSEWQVFEYTSPINHYTYEVFGPPELPLQHAVLKSEVAGTVTPTKDEASLPGDDAGAKLAHWRWEVSKVPRMYEEPHMPPLHTVVQRLLLSTIPDWKEVSRWYSRLCQQPLEATSPEMKKQVETLIAGKADELAKTEAIFQWVSQNIRYAGITPETENRSPGYEPHPVKDTFEQRHGVCRDKAALLVAMLRLGGLNAYPVLIHNGPKKDIEAPQPYFNHAISCVELKPGVYTLMDSTDENTQRLLPAYLGNQSYLVAKPDGETLLTSPVSPAEENLMVIRTRGSLAAGGQLNAESELVFNGVNDNIYRYYFRQWTPEEVRRYFEGAVKSAAPGARLLDLTITPEDFADTKQTITVRLRFSAQDVLVANSALGMLPAPFLGARVGMANFILRETGLEKRKYPFLCDPPCGVREELTLTLGAGLGDTLSLPEMTPVDTRAVGWRRTLKREGAELKGQSEFQIKVPELTPVEYLELRESLKNIEYQSRKMPIFAVAAGPAAAAAGPAGVDRQVLNEEVEYDVRDSGNWTETRTVEAKFLTYGAIKRYGEIHVNFNPVWEEVTLDQCTVTLKNGEKRAIKPQEINTMEEGWVGGAPRYPPGKQLVALLPGLEAGCTVAYKLRQVKKNRPFLAFRESFRDHDPIVRKVVRVKAPTGLRLQVLADATGTVQATTKWEGDAMIREWTASNQPGLKREGELPPMWALAPTVFVSTGDWAKWARGLHQALQQAAENAPACAARAQAALKDVATPEARIKAIRDLVATTVRAAGPELQELPFSAITPADKVLADGYGYTADRAVVLAAMLKAVGLAPEYVAVSSAPRVAQLQGPFHDSPDPTWLDQVLVQVAGPAGPVYLNDSDQYAALGATEAEDRPGLSLPDGTPMVITPAKDHETRTVTAYRIELAENGDAVITKTRRFYGTQFADWNKKFTEMPPEERHRYHQEAIAQIAQAAVPAGDLTTDFTKYPGTEALTVKVAKFGVSDGDCLYCQFPESLRDLLGLRADQRENPLFRDEARRHRLEFEVVVPPQFQLVLPEAPAAGQAAPAATELVNWRGSAGAIGVTSRLAGQTLTIVQTGELVPAVVTAKDYPGLLEAQRQLAHPRTRTLLLRRPAAK